MTVSSLKSYQEEATRLLQQLLDLLHNVSHHSALLNDAQTTEQQSFTPSKLASRISILNGEMAKLENLEMVLAIVGTAKAGKSTTINAIVGREIMPNHNRPMTALPTLIRHTPLQKEPQLRFDHIEPISQLFASLRDELKKPEIKELSKELLKGPDDSDMANLLEMIQKHYRFKTRYKGAVAIYEFLQMFNDLVRLADKFGCEFPFAEYSEINQLPVIEVEFAHLAELNQSHGRLTLLDTPGPNEAGQPHLRTMLREQLQKASAVLSVMDYTQLGLDADDEMHRELGQVAEMVDRRMFALVNKFDQKGANTDDEVATRKRVVQLAHFFSEDKVFPVSSKQAYWANAARGAITSNGSLPDYRQHPWVEEFASSVLGFSWKSQLDNIDTVKQAADYLWEQSKFSAPLEQVIISAYNRTGVVALESASVRLVETAAALEAFLSQRSTVLNRSIKELQSEIESLQQSIDRLSASERETRQQLDETLKKAEREAEKVFLSVKKQALKKVDGYFKEGKRLELKKRIGGKKNEKNKGIKPTKKSGIEQVISRMWEALATSDASDFDPTEKKLSYDTRKEAKAMLTTISRSVEKILQQGQENIELSASEVLRHIEKELTVGAQCQAEELLKELEQRLGTDDLVLNISIPEIAGCIKPKLSISELMDDVVSKNTEMKTSWYRSSGVWGKVCYWFNSMDWGWDSYEEEVTQFQIDLPKVRNRYSKAIDNTFEGLSDKLLEQIRLPVEQGVNDFYTQISDGVKQVQGNWQQGVRDQELTQAEQQRIVEVLQNLGRHLPDYKEDISSLKVEVDELSNVNKEAA